MPEIPENFAEAVRSAYGRPVDDATAERHVAAMVREAREVADPPSAPLRAPAPWRRRALRPALAVGLAALVLPGGLAVAGVRLPEAATAPYDLVGVELPNQASDTAEENVPERIPAATTPTPSQAPASPAVPDGGVREGHGADDDAARERQRRRRSEERNKRRRGDEQRRENRPKTDPQDPPRATPAVPATPNGNGRQGTKAPKPEPKPKTTPQRARPSAPQQGTKQRTTPVRPSKRAEPVMPNKPVKPEKLPRGDAPTP